MGRPRTPLVVRRHALETALGMIDAEGVEAFSVRRLAQALGVTSPSLYHHFGTRAEIVRLAGRLALADVWAGQPGEGPWRDWLWTGGLRLRSALLRHPAFIPVIASQQGDGVLARALDSWTSRLRQEGVPSAGVLPIVESVVQLAVGSALQGTAAEPGVAGELAGSHPALARGVADRGLSGDECFEIMLRQALDGLEAAVCAPEGQWSRQPSEAGEASSSVMSGVDQDAHRQEAVATDLQAVQAMTRGPGRPPEPDPGDAREVILCAGREAFNEAGYEGTAFSEVARRAGTSRQAVHYHFGGKQELFRAIFESTRSAVIEAGVKSAAEADQLGDQLAAFLRAAVRADSLDPSHARFIAGSVIDAFRVPELRPTGQDQVEQVREFLADALQQAQRADQINPEADLAALTEMLLAAMWGMALHTGYLADHQSMAAGVHELIRLLTTAD